MKVIMMTELKLPWDGMSESSKRRVEIITNHNIYWVTDINGRFGIFIESKSEFDSLKATISIKGIDVIKRNSSTHLGELILLLNEMEDSRIFSKLCEDLVSTINLHEDNKSMISAIEVRLMRWQELLKKRNSKGMSIPVQMGLFTELIFLMNVLCPRIGEEQAINAWVGPDYDKQDFLLDKAVVEIKSYRTSKGPQVSISSAQQLYCEKQPLYLVAYGLTRSNNGESVADIVEVITKHLSSKSKLLLDIFNLKLIDFGYIPEIETEPYVKFLIDTVNIFQIADGFPRLIPQMIPLEIISLKYIIDLSMCSRSLSTFSSLFAEE